MRPTATRAIGDVDDVDGRGRDCTRRVVRAFARTRVRAGRDGDAQIRDGVLAACAVTTALVTLESANAVTFEARAWLGEDPQACVDEAIAAANGSECVLRGRFALEAPLRLERHGGAQSERVQQRGLKMSWCGAMDASWTVRLRWTNGLMAVGT